jgi:hypothetical protein
MKTPEPRKGDRHKHPPIAYRPPVGVREPLAALSEETGQGFSVIITEALRRYLNIETPAAPSEAAGS